jgi:large conductance mechanosensitive channel
VLKGFREFIMRGNVVELAIAVAIGGAFAALVKAVLDSLVSPIINAIGASGGKAGIGVYLRSHNDATFINISAIINAIIIFLATAAAIYFLIVVPLNKINAIRARRIAQGEPDPDPKPDDVALLEEIRDLLKAQTPNRP